MKIFITFFAILTINVHKHINYDIPLNDFRNRSYFLVIGVKSHEYTGLVTVENGDLYSYCLQNMGLTVQEYIVMMKEKLSKNSTLDINGLIPQNFQRIKSFESIDQNAEKGKSEFIEFYFNGNVLRNGYSDDERAAIIGKLFKWGVLTIADCESGELILDE